MAPLAQRDLVARSSHELRTPLTSILGYLEEALDVPDGLTDEARDLVLTAYRNAQRLHSLVDDLLTLDQLTTKDADLRCEPITLTALLEPVTRDFLVLCIGKSLRFVVPSPPPNVELIVDAARTRQLLENMLSNALQYTAEGGTLAITCELNGALCEINVMDTGIGIPADELSRVFDQFFRSRASARAAIPGTGLGLSIARSLAEAQGGSLVVASVEGVGTTFTLSVPIALVPVGVS